ncbi:hypothetical protein GIB67_026939 [Kingdonia uniflora]|uniref:S-protein homolog n=1 Tax=Kingdonia uniflora TaxID=39325 RepID=A0A7J7P238_9MAGN|nr:hypothetical protein GIB67_026939 [Kingdonia uniflora]
MGLNGTLCWSTVTSAIIQPDYFGRKVHVFVTNQLGTPLKLICRSKDTTFGDHWLNHQQFFSWKFQTNLWGTTLFWCSMTWKNPQGYFITGSVDVFNFSRDGGGRCMGDCRWFVRQEGVYQINNFNDKVVFMYKW